MSKLKVIDLFAGTGAFSTVFNKYENYEISYANDFCKNSKIIFDQNHKIKLDTTNLNNVKLKDIPKHDILCAGFPCQPFSISGQQKGFKDERSNCFWSMLKIIKKYKPRILILENVKNLTTHDKCKTFKTIEQNLEKEGYILKYKVLNTKEITTIPQNRERIYIIGFKNKKDADNFNFEFTETKNKPIRSFLEKNPDNKFYYTKDSAIYSKIFEKITKNIKDNVVYQYRRFYVRENKNNNVPTLTANMGTGGHNVPIIKDNKGIRKLTPKECFNLQGFPKDYKLDGISNSGLYKLAGNAVSVPVVDLIIKKINKVLEND
uniref:DNA (cytosine-5-)-methyltransferase n=1 Tax=viral metagenome TaxID=1070528 RepID=A0A6C0AC57_9ZZZZ